MVTKRRKLNILLVLISIAPLYLELIYFFLESECHNFYFKFNICIRIDSRIISNEFS